MKAARQAEMEFLFNMHVYDRVPSEHQRQHGGKVIGTRLVDVNKGDIAQPDYKSRLGGQESATHRDDSLYAPLSF